MKISCLVQRCATSCTTHDTLERAAQLMWKHDLGCLPVIDDGQVAGIITDRDVCVAACTRSEPLRSVGVADLIAGPAFACRESDEVEVVERAMSEHRLRRMPVVDEQGHPIGSVSLADISRAAGAYHCSAEAVTAPR